MRIRSSAFADGKGIPVKYSRDGENVSPPLTWADVPSGARELALLFENLTPRTQEPFAHWVVYGIDPAAGGLPEGFRHKREPDEPEDVRHGTNDIGNIGYDGPLGSVGRTFRYRFRLLALDRPLALPPGADRATVLAEARGHIVAEAELAAQYQRPP